MGVVVFNRQFFIYLDGPSKGVSLDICRHTLLTKNEIKVIMVHILSICATSTLIILSSVSINIYIYILTIQRNCEILTLLQV